MKRVLKYPGSKWNLAPKLLTLIPKHHTYLEPFFGSGALFFSKAPSSIETINDMDNNVVNLFSCIRNDPERLARMVMAVPYSRYQYEQSYKAECDDPYENALQFLIKCWQGYGFRTNGYMVGWKNDVQGRESMYALWNWYRLPEEEWGAEKGTVYFILTIHEILDMAAGKEKIDGKNKETQIFSEGA